MHPSAWRCSPIAWFTTTSACTTRMRRLCAAAIGGVCAARGKRQLVVPDGFPTELIPDSVEAVPDTMLSYEDLDRREGVLTTATIAIALTGTIVLTHGAGQGRRAATLIPDYHLCLVRADQIVETVPEAFRRLASIDPALITTISGPSATADIEMIRVRGVHGPRTLDVIIVGAGDSGTGDSGAGHVGPTLRSGGSVLFGAESRVRAPDLKVGPTPANRVP